MMQGILPPEALELLQETSIPNMFANIRDEVEPALLKVWQNQQLEQGELDLDITPAEVTALWTMTHRRPIRMDTARQAVQKRKGNRVKPSHQWGSGPAVRRLYRLGDVLEVRIREKRPAGSSDHE